MASTTVVATTSSVVTDAAEASLELMDASVRVSSASVALL